MIPLVLMFGYSESFFLLTAIACVFGFLNGYANAFVPLMVSEYSGERLAASAGGVTGSRAQIVQPGCSLSATQMAPPASKVIAVGRVFVIGAG